MNMFTTIVSCIDAEAASASAARYRQLMLRAEKLEAIADLSHDKRVIHLSICMAVKLREEAETIDFPQETADREAEQAERERCR